jgi:hypothetical protein
MNRISRIACVLLLAGCGTDQGADEQEAVANTDASAPDRVVACDLLPGSDVADIMGQPVQETLPEEYGDSSDTSPDAPYMTSCTYTSEAGETLRTATIQVTRAPEVTDPAAALQLFVEGLREFGPEVNVAPVPDLGPGAGWHAEVQQLSVFRPGWRIMASVHPQVAIPGLDGAKLLASRMLERLPESQ